MNRIRLFLLLGLLTAPLPALALQTTTWSFLNGDVQGKWEVKGWDNATPTAEGLRITTTKDGTMARTITDLTHPVDAVSFSVIATMPIEGQLLWHPHDAAPGLVGQLPFVIQGTGLPETIHVSGNGLSSWDTESDLIGLRLPAGANVLLQGVAVHHWNVYEKAAELWRSFWTFDTQLPYSINFLWGPLTVTNPAARAVLFDGLPPRGHSGVWIFYGILAVTAILALSWYVSGTGKERSRIPALSKSALLFATVAAGCWLMFDLRMSLEYWSYVRTDFVTYVNKTDAQKQFRNMENVYAVMDAIRPHLSGETEFILLTGTPQIGTATRYLTYPALPVDRTKAQPDTRTWLVFREPAATVTADGRLTIGGEAVTGTGKILERFTDGSFLFRVNP